MTPPAFQLSYLFLWLESGSTYRRPPADLIPALFTASQSSLSHIGLQLGSGSPTKLVTDTFDLVACQIHSLSLTLRSSDELIGGLLSKCVNLAALEYTIKPFTDPLTSTRDPLASLAKAAITTLAVDELMGAIPPYANVLNIVDTISTFEASPLPPPAPPLSGSLASPAHQQLRDQIAGDVARRVRRALNRGLVCRRGVVRGEYTFLWRYPVRRLTLNNHPGPRGV